MANDEEEKKEEVKKLGKDQKERVAVIDHTLYEFIRILHQKGIN